MADLIITLVIALFSAILVQHFGRSILLLTSKYLGVHSSIHQQVSLFPVIGFPFELWIAPAFFTSIWLWLYVGSGFLLKAARRLDIAVDRINRRMDEKKALSTIG